MMLNQPIKTTGENLAGLWKPSFVEANNKLYVFGGGGIVTDNLHFLDLKTMRWETIKNTMGKQPSKRYGHTANHWKDSIILFGGCDEYQEYCNDIHVFNLKTLTWYQPIITGSVPSRYLHSGIIHHDKLIVYGGFAKNSECTYVLDELSVLDLNSWEWTTYNDMPPRYNHSTTLIGDKLYIYAGKDEQGNTVNDLFMINLSKLPYTYHLVLGNNQQPTSIFQFKSQQLQSNMVLLKSQHFSHTACGKLFVFGRFLVDKVKDTNYSLWMLDLDTLIWEKREPSGGLFDKGGWNYFTILNQKSSHSSINNLLFLGNTDLERPQGYDHFRDALVINLESIGLYDIPNPRHSTEFTYLLNNPELSDFSIITSDDQTIHVHQIILLTRWPYFSKMISSGMSESNRKQLIIPEPSDVVLPFLKFIYTNSLDDKTPWPLVCELLVLSNMYLLHRLKKICCERLSKIYLSLESCGLIFEKATMIDEAPLKLIAMNFMIKNHNAILKSNMLLTLPSYIQDEFLDAVSEKVTLETPEETSFTNDNIRHILNSNYSSGSTHVNSIDQLNVSILNNDSSSSIVQGNSISTQ